MTRCVAPQKLRALLKPSSAAAQKMPGAIHSSSNGNAAKEQTVSQAFAVRICGASGCLPGVHSNNCSVNRGVAACTISTAKVR